MQYKSVSKKEREENAKLAWNGSWDKLALVVCRKLSVNPNMHPTGIMGS